MSNFKQFFEKIQNAEPYGAAPFEYPVSELSMFVNGLPVGFTRPSDNHNIIVNTDSGNMYALYEQADTPLQSGFEAHWPETSTDGGVVLSDLLVTDQSLLNRAKKEFETLTNVSGQLDSNLVPYTRLVYLAKNGDTIDEYSLIPTDQSYSTNVILLLNKNANDMDINATELTLFAAGDSSKNIKIIDRVDNESDSTKKEWMIGTNGVDRFGTGNDSNAKNVHVEFKQGFVSGNNNVYVRDGSSDEYHLKNKIDTLVNDYTAMHQGLPSTYSADGSRYKKIQSAIDNTLFADYDRTFIKMREQFDEEIASNNLAMIATTIDSVSGNSNANSDALNDLESSSNALKVKTDTIGTKTNPSSDPVNDDSVETLLQWSRCFVPQPINYNASIGTMRTALNDITGVGTGSDTGTVETLINLRHNRQRLDKQLLSLKSAVHTSRVVMKSSGDNFSNELTNIIKEVNTFVQNSMSAFEGEVVRKQIALQTMMEDLSSLQAKLYFSQQQYKQSATELNHFYSWYVNTNGLQ